MAQPTWLADWFAAVMVTISLYCIARLALARRLERRNETDVTLAHVLMGFAMVGMLVPRWNVLPNGPSEVVFAVLAAYFLVRGLRFLSHRGARAPGQRRQHVTHLLVHTVMACAMLYMYWLGMPLTVGPHEGMVMSGPPRGAGDPSLTLLLVIALVVSAVWQLDAISRFRSDPQPALASLGGTSTSIAPGTPELSDARPWLAPRLAMGCHVVMALTMAYLLVLMT